MKSPDLVGKQFRRLTVASRSGIPMRAERIEQDNTSEPDLDRKVALVAGEMEAVR